MNQKIKIKNLRGARRAAPPPRDRPSRLPDTGPTAPHASPALSVAAATTGPSQRLPATSRLHVATLEQQRRAGPAALHHSMTLWRATAQAVSEGVRRALRAGRK